MAHQRNWTRDRAADQVGLDHGGRRDSQSRRAVTDVDDDLGAVDGEADLLFAHLREALGSWLAGDAQNGIEIDE